MSNIFLSIISHVFTLFLCIRSESDAAGGFAPVSGANISCFESFFDVISSLGFVNVGFDTADISLILFMGGGGAKRSSSGRFKGVGCSVFVLFGSRKSLCGVGI